MTGFAGIYIGEDRSLIGPHAEVTWQEIERWQDNGYSILFRRDGTIYAVSREMHERVRTMIRGNRPTIVFRAILWWHAWTDWWTRT